MEDQESLMMTVEIDDTPQSETSVNELLNKFIVSSDDIVTVITHKDFDDVDELFKEMFQSATNLYMAVKNK